MRLAALGVFALVCFVAPSGSHLFSPAPVPVSVPGQVVHVPVQIEPSQGAWHAQSSSTSTWDGLLGWSLLGFGAVAALSVVSSSTGEGLDFKMSFKRDGEVISPWHDIPAYETPEEVNFVCEIPKYGLAKMECDTKGENNPIIQDSKKGKARFYHGPIFWNYGYVPQTWEDPSKQTKGYSGDGDPLDVVEIGSTSREMGSINVVKPLGVLAMIDEGEIDWKMIAISKDDPLAEKLNDISDVEPRVISGIREWFRWYKTPDDKPLNEFEFDEAALDKAKALEVVAETHAHWRSLKDGTTEKGKMWVTA